METIAVIFILDLGGFALIVVFVYTLNHCWMWLFVRREMGIKKARPLLVGLFKFNLSILNFLNQLRYCFNISNPIFNSSNEFVEDSAIRKYISGVVCPL